MEVHTTQPLDQELPDGQRFELVLAKDGTRPAHHRHPTRGLHAALGRVSSPSVRHKDPGPLNVTLA